MFENAVKGQLKNTSATVEELKIAQEQDRDVQARVAVEQVEQVQMSSDELKKSIAESMQKFDYNQRKELIGPKFMELLGDLDYRKSEDVSKLSETLKYIEQLQV